MQLQIVSRQPRLPLAGGYALSVNDLANFPGVFTLMTHVSSLPEPKTVCHDER
jgi:hypothetical protein